MRHSRIILRSDALFQSHIGAIRIGLPKHLPSKTLCDFNPTLVQLESDKVCHFIHIWINFNPTLVQLESDGSVLRRHGFFDFNPTLVQLEYEQVGAQQISRADFNPTLVQLESSTAAAWRWNQNLFQSHIGAIRIAALRTISVASRNISIPHWCN